MVARPSFSCSQIENPVALLPSLFSATLRTRRAGRDAPARHAQIHAEACEIVSKLLRAARGEHRAFGVSATGRAEAKIIPPVNSGAVPVNTDDAGANVGEQIAIGNINGQVFRIFRHRNRLSFKAFARGGNLLFGGGNSRAPYSRR